MNTFEFNRLLKLIKIDILTHKKTILVTLATLIAIFALLPFHISSSSDAYFFVLYTVGFAVTNRAFNEMHDPRKAFTYLTLPCSNLERLISKFLVTTILISITLVVIFYLCSVFSVFMNKVLYNNSVTLFDLSAFGLWSGIGKYIIFQSIFFLGAAYFQKGSTTKTTLVLCCIFIVLSLLLFLFSWMICPSCNQSGMINLITKSFDGLNFIFWILVAPICWVFTYLRITECEIK